MLLSTASLVILAGWTQAFSLVKRSGFQNLPAHIASDFATGSISPPVYLNDVYDASTMHNNRYRTELPEYMYQTHFDEEAQPAQWPVQPLSDLERADFDHFENEPSYLDDRVSSMTLKESDGEPEGQFANPEHSRRGRRLNESRKQKEGGIRTVKKKGFRETIFGGGSSGSGEGSTPTRSRGGSTYAATHDGDEAPGPSSGHKKHLSKGQKEGIIVGSLAGACILGYGAKTVRDIHKANKANEKIMSEMAERNMPHKRSLVYVKDENARDYSKNQFKSSPRAI